MRKKNDDEELKIRLRGYFIEKLPRLLDELEKMEGKAYIDRMLSIAEFFLPKVSRQEIDQQVTVPIQVSLNAVSKPLEIEGEVIDE